MISTDLILFLGLALIVGLYFVLRKVREKARLRQALDKVVSKEVAVEMLKSALEPHSEERVVTLLFSDIRNFTRMTNDLMPQETMEILNQYMTMMSQVIEGEGGVIDKFVGDEIMALFGAPVSMEDHGLKALSTAQLMMAWLQGWNVQRKEAGKPPIAIGIGVHTGPVLVGNMGTPNRFNYTAIGRNVNLAARLCQVAAPMQILLSEATLNEPRVRESFHVKQLPPITPKGFDVPVPIYEITGFKWELS